MTNTFLFDQPIRIYGDSTTADPEILLDTSSIATTYSRTRLSDSVEADIEEASAPATSVNDGLGSFSISKKVKRKGKRRVLLKCADEEVGNYDY